MPNSNSQQSSSPEAHIPQLASRGGQGAAGRIALGEDWAWMPQGQSEGTSLS